MPKPEEVIKGLGAKYGGTLRKRYARVYRTQRAARDCPSCSSKKLRRQASGIWACRACGFTMAGGAYDVAPPEAR